MAKRKSRPDNFKAIEWAQGPETSWPLPWGPHGRHAWADATDKYRALAGALLRAVKRAKDIRCPRPTPADKQYDVARARGYFEAMTGREAGNAVWADYPVHGEKRCRVRWVMDGKTLWEIPHWDWNGHNATVEDCLVHDLLIAA